VIIWAVSSGTAYDYFDLLNVGTADLSGFNFSATNVLLDAGGKKAPVVTFDACVNGVWNTRRNSCSGTMYSLGSTSASGLSIAMPSLAVGARIAVRATTKPNTQYTAVTTVNLTVSRVQVRAGLAGTN
jgi:hypothetical protein